MSNEISRIYQFLSNQGDWVVKADKNSDGNITKDEFRTFMEDFEWNGETSDKNDLINEFWAKFDTNRSRAKINGSSVADMNALNPQELAVLDKRIEMNETLNDFTTTLSCPNIISGSSKAWKEDVTAKLQNLLETYIAQGGTNENLLSYLEEQSPAIENKVTAEYCAAEYLDEVMPELNKEYGYAYGDDKDLNKLINDYAQNLAEGVTPEDMKATLVRIIDAYLATAGLKESNGVDLGSWGYNTDDKAPLNDLQESVAKSTLTQNLEAIKNDEYYEAFADTIDAAVTAFIEETISNATAADYQSILKYGVEQFKQSEAYQEIKTTMDVKQVMIFNNDNAPLYQAITKELGNSIAEILTEGVYFDAYEEIINQAIEKANDGAFDVNGKFDVQALVEWAVDEIKENLTTIINQSGSAEDLSNADLYELYLESASAADDMMYTDSDKSLQMHKDAALAYCEAIAAKGEQHEALVEEICEIELGSSSYASAIKSCKKPSDLEALIKAISAEVDTVKETSNVKVRDKSQAVINDINSTMSYKGVNISQVRSKLAFKVDEDGSITFIGNNYDEVGGVWDPVHNQPDGRLNHLINNQLKNKLQAEYSNELEGLNLTQNEKDNLFNLALLMTLSDTTVVRSMYDEINIGVVIEKVVENYSQMLAKVSTDENARNYIKTVQNKSILNGMSTWSTDNTYYNTDNIQAKTLDKYYKNNSTNGGDDWVSIGTRKEESFTVGGATGNIVLLASGSAGDDNAVNNAMKSILTDYVNSYNDVIEPARVIELFREAQQTAFAKLETVKDQNKADGTSIYGYGESNAGCGNYDTYTADGNFYSVNCILINVIYEMERLISKEVMGM